MLLDIKNKIYIILCLTFSILIIVGNLIYQKFVIISIGSLHDFELSAGAVLYPLTFLITDLIAEFYNKEHANFCVRMGIIFNILVALIIILINHLSATSWSKVNDETFDLVFGSFSIAFIGSMIACYTAQIIDLRLYLWIKKLTGSRMLWLRNNVSTAISLLIDTSIVASFLCLVGIIPVDRLIMLICNAYIFKIFFTICSTPLFYAAVGVIQLFFNEKNLNIK